MKQTLIICFSLILASCNYAQNNKSLLGGPCEGCEAVHEYGNQKLTSKATLSDFYQKGQQIKITGTVYQKDGKTPAHNVLLYVYHTDQNGKYTAKSNAIGWEKRHGSIRGWMKTDEKGQYTFYTLKPASYPSRSEPAHIHLTVKEPNKKEYYMDSFYFHDDPLLTDKIKDLLKNRGGNGILKLKKEKEWLVGKRDIVLGENIPHYY